MVFQPGNNLGSKGAPSKRILNAIYEKFQENIQLFLTELDKEIKENPTKAYRTYIQPLLPKNVELSNDEQSAGFKIIINKANGTNTNAQTN